MSLSQYDVVKAEKADAMRKYERKKQFGYCFFWLVPCMLILWMSFSWPLHTPSFISSPFSCRYYPFYYPSNTTSTNNSGLSSCQHLFPFLVLNAIVFLIYYLSNKSTGSNNDDERNDAVSTKPSDIYDQYVSYSSSSYRGTAAKAAVNVTFQDKEIVRVEENIIPSHRLTATAEKLFKEDRRINDRRSSYERSKSDVTVTEEKKKSPQLRRTETEKGLVVARSTSSDDKKSMEEMNSEEFRTTVERFIASKKKKILMDEMTCG